MSGGLLGPFDPYAALRASQSQETDAYGNPIQGAVDPSQFLDQSALAKLGWTGGNGSDANQGAMSQDQPHSLQNNPDFTNWLTQNQYSLGGGMMPGDEKSTGYLTDASGGKLAQGNYDGSDGGMFMALAAAGLGGFGMQAAGLGGGALGGSEGVGSSAASTAGAEGAAMPGSQIGALEAAPTMQSGQMSLDALRASELGGYASNGALPSSAAVNTPWSAGDYLRNAGANINQALSPVSQPMGQATQWMKDNPLLGKLAMSAGGTLLGGMAGGQGSRPAAPHYGPAMQWNSPISPVAQQGGLLGGPQQQAQPGMGGGLLGGGSLPPGMLGGGGMAGLGAPKGYANNGAWQWMKGG